MPAKPVRVKPRSRPWIWAVYLCLFAGSIPWYLPADEPLQLWFGLPHWVVISLGAYLGVALFTVWVVRNCWPDPDPDAPADAAADAADAPGGATAREPER